MLLAQVSTSTLWLLFGTIVLCALVIARRALFASGSGSAPASSAGPAEEDANSILGRRVGALEVRLHDFAREAEARLETRIAQLDRLIDAADRDIVRLTELLNANRDRTGSRVPDVVRAGIPQAVSSDQPELVERATEPARVLSGAQREMASHLYEAGFSIPEIAHMVGRSNEEVRSILSAA